MKRIFSILLFLISVNAIGQQKHITLRASIDTAYFLTQEHFYNSIDSLVAIFGPGGITALTGDVTAGPGTGTQAATLATVNSNVGTFSNATITVNGKGLVTAASTGASSGIPIDSVYLRRFGTNLIHGHSWNTNNYLMTTAPQNTTLGNDSTNFFSGYLSGNDITSGRNLLGLGSHTLYKATTAFNTIAIGAGAGGSVSSAAYTGSANVFIGTGNIFASLGATAPGRVATTATANVVIGGERTASAAGAAGGAITTATENTILGAGAGRSVSTGTRNTIIGASAGVSISTVSNNTLIGFDISPVMTAANNTIIGTGAATALTSGSLDAFGLDAGDDFTTGSRNFSFGTLSFSGTSTTNTGSDNVGIGYSAGLHTNSLGAIATNRNTVIGNYSGAGLNSGGNDNTFIGYATGNGTNSAGTSVTGTNNIAIGAAAALPSTTSGSQIQFWVGATGGTGGYNALTRFTGGQWLLNNTTSAVTSAPNTSAALEINGTTGGVILPRLTTTQRNALTAATGMTIYCTDCTAGDASTGVTQTYNGTTWKNHW